jgi:hypothetical protein
LACEPKYDIQIWLFYTKILVRELCQLWCLEGAHDNRHARLYLFEWNQSSNNNSQADVCASPVRTAVQYAKELRRERNSQGDAERKKVCGYAESQSQSAERALNEVKRIHKYILRDAERFRRAPSLSIRGSKGGETRHGAGIPRAQILVSRVRFIDIRVGRAAFMRGGVVEQSNEFDDVEVERTRIRASSISTHR